MRLALLHLHDNQKKKNISTQNVYRQVSIVNIVADIHTIFRCLQNCIKENEIQVILELYFYLYETRWQTRRLSKKKHSKLGGRVSVRPTWIIQDSCISKQKQTNEKLREVKCVMCMFRFSTMNVIIMFHKHLLVK